MLRNVIMGLRPVTWENPSRQNEFVQSVMSALGALGEEIDYPLLCAVSGCAFRASFSMPSSQPWNHGNYHVVHTPPIVEHTFRMFGYRVAHHIRGDFELDRRRIVDSIDRGVPVITLDGVINCADACVIAGYDDDGNVLLGFSPFSDVGDDHSEPDDITGAFRKSGWHGGFFAGGSQGRVLIIEGKAERPDDATVLAETLRLAARLIGEPCLVPGQHNGLAAHRAFAQALRTYAWDDNSEPYLNVMCNFKQYLDRRYAAEYLRMAGRNDLADLYTRIAATVDEMGHMIPQDFSAADLFSSKHELEPYCRAIEQIAELEERALPLMA
ncbi:MAG: hypothetical protein NT029_09500 [Armatimonadetes bacterium]|nr:hypothetical protein [Armatimonadota bacterium]